MRKAPKAKNTAISLPRGGASDVEPDKALDDNERYKVVWTVLNALRAHDDRFNATVNKIELNKKRPANLVGRPQYTLTGRPASGVEQAAYEATRSTANGLQFDLQRVFARLVQKVGDRRYWEQWARTWPKSPNARWRASTAW